MKERGLGGPQGPPLTFRQSAAVLSCAAALLITGCFAHQYRHNPRIAVVDGDPIVQMKPRGEMPSVQRPTLVEAENHSDPPDEGDRVLGLVFGTEARAYPIGLLDRFEVVNDVSGEIPFVVVRCALTGIAAAFDRRAEDRTLTFENSGALWRDTLVLRDRETGTYWSAATGRALSGELEGREMRAIPVALTRDELWRKAHPESLYLDLGRSTAVPFAMRLYEASPAQGVSGLRTDDRRFKPKEEVVVVGDGREAVAFRAKELRHNRTVVVPLDGRPIAIEWDPALQTPRAYQTGAESREMPLLSMYWFAVGRHFKKVRPWPEKASPRAPN